MGVLDDYMLVPGLSLLDKVRLQAQVLVPVLRALRTELGRVKADAIVKKALRDWSSEVFARSVKASTGLRGASSLA
jgi:hypothetical protein